MFSTELQQKLWLDLNQWSQTQEPHCKNLYFEPCQDVTLTSPVSVEKTSKTDLKHLHSGPYTGRLFSISKDVEKTSFGYVAAQPLRLGEIAAPSVHHQPKVLLLDDPGIALMFSFQYLKIWDCWMGSS